ncbi:hypothetical protein RvY_15995 [Ramazzottius varieornatus]|uniref:Uncharacterized protein n=1 Tax=Ramazzottius varieornatus TaxID=947166 RepID=A0A1D1W3J6_RAMVA|nr:hypothetical protein RvY_15995 [Ramazzottius varieornatus]
MRNSVLNSLREGRIRYGTRPREETRKWFSGRLTWKYMY